LFKSTVGAFKKGHTTTTRKQEQAFLLAPTAFSLIFGLSQMLFVFVLAPPVLKQQENKNK
jgi:hypothetical protein